MNAKELLEGVNAVDDQVLESAVRVRKTPRRRIWRAAIAAILVVAIGVGAMIHFGGRAELPLVPVVHALSEAKYPELPPYPDHPSDLEAWNAWHGAMRSLHGKTCDAASLAPFLRASIGRTLSGAGGDNRLYSPLSSYLALSMLAELTDGESRAQILALLGAERIETLRENAGILWQTHYQNDAAATSVLANSLWLNQELSFRREVIDRLSESYYASVYQGEMGSKELNEQLQAWINTQTNNLLEGQTGGLETTPESVLSLVNTVSYHARWVAGFSEERTALASFHGAGGDEICDFMHGDLSGSYFWFDRFSAIFLEVENGMNWDSGMWLLLPDEGVTPEDLLTDAQALDFLSMTRDQRAALPNQKPQIIHLSLPKFDVSGELSLKDSLQALGVTDVFDADKADFSPLSTAAEGFYVSEVRQGLRTAVDEEGITAAAYTYIGLCGSAAPPSEEIDFTLDRPFLFALTGNDGLPLMTGVVNRIAP